ncbi:MAG: radical SAM protein, partial [Candidatus Micrarchaeaceae archaeon]
MNRSNIAKSGRTLSIMPTYTCPAACKDCGTLSSPQDHNKISIETIKSAIDQARTLDFVNVVFTGGEPTLRWRDLLEGIRYASDAGFPTRVVTNAHWARTMERAQRVIDALVAAGLTEINFSTGDEHVRFIPVDNIYNAIESSFGTRMPIALMIELRRERKVTRSAFEAHERFRAFSKEDLKRLKITESPWMPLDPLTAGDYSGGIAATRENVSTSLPCDNVMQTYVVEADGRVASCCGLGMRMIPELNIATVDEPQFLAKAIERAEDDFVKLMIRYWGPNRIVAWAAEKDPTILWEGMYAHHCQTCKRMYSDEKIKKIIREHYKEAMTDVVFTEYLYEIHIPNMALE